jgi:hypothetical protein
MTVFRTLCPDSRVRVRVTYFRVTRELQTRCKGRAYASGSSRVSMYTPHTRHMRVTTCVQLDFLGRGGCANIIGLGLVRVTYFRVTRELQTRCKGRAYASGSGGVSMYTPHTWHMRVTTRVQLDSGSRWMCKHYRVRVS